MAMAPLVSVVMSVYDGERYLAESIESILNQTFGDFEFILINDGSTDRTSSILHRYEMADHRVRVYYQENRGLIASLNRGCGLARGKYIARMDADDVSLRERLTRQVHYMEAHPMVGVLGTWVEYIDENGTRRGDWRMPTMPALIGWSLFFGTCLAHPSVVMRRDVVERLGFYRPEALHVEDYDLWVRASVVTRIANIPEILLQRRAWAGNIGSRHSQIQEENVVKVMQAMFGQLPELEISATDTACLRKMAVDSSLTDGQQAEHLSTIIQKLCRAYLEANSLTGVEAKNIYQDVGRKLQSLAMAASKISLWKGFFIFIQALKLNPQLLSTQIIAKGMRGLAARF